MPKLTNERLAEIEARAAKATPGPWVHGGGQDIQTEDEIDVADACKGDGYLCAEGLADADFIAHSRTDIPDLIAEIRRLRAQYEELRDALCAKAWAPRDNHERVVALAKMMKRRESKIEAARDGRAAAGDGEGGRSE